MNTNRICWELGYFFCQTEKMCLISVLAVEQAQQSVPQTQSQSVQSEAEPPNWFDTGDFISGNEPLLQRGRQYPELIRPSNMYQQQQQQIQQQQQVLQPVAQPAPAQQQLQPAAQNIQQPQPQSQQVAQPVQQIIQPVQQPVQQLQVQQPVQVPKPQQAVRPRPTVEKPPTYDYESNPPPRRKPSAGQRPQRPAQQGQMQVVPQQAVAVQKPQSAQVSQNSMVVNRPIQQTISGKGEPLGVQQIQPPGHHQSISGKKGSNYGPSNANQVPAQTSDGKAFVQVQPQQSNKPKTDEAPLSHQVGPQQGTQQQQKGFYIEGGFIPATNNNINSRPTNNQRNQNNAYRNMFNKDRYRYQYQNPLYGAQKPYGRQYDNYDYNTYVYGETPPSNYNYDYNSGILFIILVFLLCVITSYGQDIC